MIVTCIVSIPGLGRRIASSLLGPPTSNSSVSSTATKLPRVNTADHFCSEPPTVTAWFAGRFAPSSSTESARGMAWFPSRVSDAVPTVRLRRISDPSDELEVSTLRQALDKNPVVIEICDDGPFFEDDCRLGTKTRMIRAKPGFRPMFMILVDSSSLAIVRASSAARGETSR